MTWNYQRGYIGSRMSERAADAYHNGLMTLSKWTKDDILERIFEEKEEIYEAAKKLTKQELVREFLVCNEWHHTGKYYNETDFYAFNDEIDYIDEDYISNIIKSRKPRIRKSKEEKATEEEVRYAYCTWLEWSGSRKHPVSYENSAYGTVKGNWFYIENPYGTQKKKNLTGNWIENIEYFASKEEMDNRKEAKRLEVQRIYEEKRMFEEEKEQKKKAKSIKKIIASSDKKFKQFKEHYLAGEYEESNKGNIYPVGRKPSPEDYAKGLSNFFEVGEECYRATRDRNCNIAYFTTYIWNGTDWEKYEEKSKKE